MNLKKIVFLSVCAFLVVLTAYFLYFWSFTNKTYQQPLGGWEELKTKIEAKYASENQDIQKAAIFLGKAYQEAIDYPEKAQEIRPRLSKANSCFTAVLEHYGKNSKESYSEFTLMEDLSTSSFERQRRYIAYNAKLSGAVYPLVDDSLKNCNFSLVGSK